MSKINDGGPAFPMPASTDGNGNVTFAEYGMSLRDWFAGTLPEPSEDRVNREREIDRAANPHNESHKPPMRNDREIRAYLRYQYADAMLAERDRKWKEGV